jgi:Bacterial DNA-binding protein
MCSIASWIEDGVRVKIGGLVQLTVRVNPATKGRNPAIGEEITIAAKKASVESRCSSAHAPAVDASSRQTRASSGSESINAKTRVLSASRSARTPGHLPDERSCDRTESGL